MCHSNPAGRSKRIATLLALASAATAIPIASAQVTLRAVAQKSDVLPDQSDPGLVFSSFSSTFVFGGATINAHGDVAFFGAGRTNSGSGVTRQGAFVERDGVLQTLALQGQAVPGLPGFDFDGIQGGRLIVGDDGSVAHGTQLEVGPNSSDVRQAILVYEADGSVRSVVRAGDTIPQIDPVSPTFGYEFQSLGPGANFISPYGGSTEFAYNDGLVGFGTTAVNPNGPGSVQGLWVERVQPDNSKALTLVARNGSDTDFFPTTQVDGISGTGELIFRTVIDTDDAAAFNAIATFNQADISLEAQTGSDAGGDVSFNSLGRPSINSIGTVAFPARFSDLPSGSDTGVFSDGGIVASEGVVAGGTPDLNNDGTSDFVFGDLLSVPVFINQQDNVLFRATARTPDNSQSVVGLWSDRSGGINNLDLVAYVGQDVPGMPGATISQIGQSVPRASLVFNANNDAAFIGQILTADGFLRTAIFAEKNGELRVIAVDEESITLPDGTTRDISFLGFLGGSGNGDGLLSGFSDNGEVAFVAGLRGSSVDNVVVLVANLNLPGDANGDDTVNLADFGILRANFGSTNGTFDTADFNGDRLVNLADFGILRANFGSSADLAILDAWAATVPEPTAGVAALAFLLLGKRRR